LYGVLSPGRQSRLRASDRLRAGAPVRAQLIWSS